MFLEVMHVSKKNKLYNIGNILRLFLTMFLVFGILVLLFLYPITKLVNIHFDLFTIMVYPCGIAFLYLVFEFIKLFKSIEDNNPFCMNNVKILKENIYISIIISVLVFISFLVSTILYDYYSSQFKVSLIFISILFFGLSIAFYILSELFRQATLYKEENDLTI